MANGKTAVNPAENPAETPAEKAAQSGTAKSSGRRNSRQNRPQAEAQGRPDKQPERTQVRPGGERPGARQSASRSGRQGERQNGRTAGGRPENSARQSRSVPEGRPSPRWTWREYALQLSVVVIGIVVTFAGSGMLERSRQARDVRAAMVLVHSELETNRMKIREVGDWIRREADAYRVLTQHRRDLKRIPQDTMDSFAPVFGRILSFHSRQDAFEVLKNSGLMASVRDKDFLLAVTQGYATLAELEENVGLYFKLKSGVRSDMSKAFSRSQQDIFYSGDMYGMWECVLSVPCSYDFILTAPYFFPEGYTEELLTDLDRSLQAIEAKYELDKKQTDD